MSINRRNFNFGLGAALVAAPFIRFLEGSARAAGIGDAAKRLVIFFSPNGTVHKHWRPTGSGADYGFAAGSILEPLTDYKKDITVIDGIDFHGVANHEPGMSAMLTGGSGAGSLTGGMSVDQYIAKSLGQGMKFASLELGAQTSAWGASNQTRMSYSAPGAYVPPDDNPKSVFERMFGEIGASDSAKIKAFNRRKSILDRVAAELKGLKKVAGKQEQIKLDAHLSALEQVENGLKSGDTSCGDGVSVLEMNPQVNDNFEHVVPAQIDLLVTALSCGMTNVASMQVSHTVGPPVFSWLGLSDGHHSLSHKGDTDTAGVADFVKAERWISEQFAYLLQKLKSLPEPTGDGTMLDHTAVLWAQEMGDGRMHDCLSVPFVVAGGPFKTGKYLKYNGEPHQKLLVSVCHAMGLNNPTFGSPGYGTGPLEGLL
jgi:hypothetical protein